MIRSVSLLRKEQIKPALAWNNFTWLRGSSLWNISAIFWTEPMRAPTRVLQCLHPDRNFRSEFRNPEGYLRYPASRSSPPFCFKIPNLSSNKPNPGSRKPTENRYGWNDRFYLFYLRRFVVLLKFEHLDVISEVRKSTDHWTIHNHHESSKSGLDPTNPFGVCIPYIQNPV